MKKNWLIAMLMLTLFACLGTGCGKEETQANKLDVYYLDKGETKIIPETHEIKSKATGEKIREAIRLLSEVPDDKELKTTLANGVTVDKYDFDQGKLILALGEHYKDLSKTKEILTRAALVKTLTQFDEIQYVIFTIGGEALLDYSGKPIGVMSADMFLDDAGEQLNNYEKITIRLYFANETGDKLIAINRSLVHNIGLSNVSLEKLVVEQILSGPVNQESFPSVNPSTKLQSITVKDGVCYVNFDSAILTPVNDVTTDVTIYSIVNSLVELSNINKVQIAIDGKTDITFKDKYELTTQFERNLSILE